jgi:hypothetical protein
VGVILLICPRQSGKRAAIERQAVIMGQGTPQDLVGAYELADAQNNEQARVVYRKRLAALGLDETGKPVSDDKPKQQSEQPAPAKSEAAEQRKADKPDTPAGRRRATPHTTQQRKPDKT